MTVNSITSASPQLYVRKLRGGGVGERSKDKKVFSVFTVSQNVLLLSPLACSTHILQQGYLQNTECQTKNKVFQFQY